MSANGYYVGSPPGSPGSPPGSPPDSPQPSRFAELALELVGAKNAADFLREVWAAATPEAKERLATAVIEKMTAQVNERSPAYAFDAINQSLRQIADQEAGRIVEGRKEELRALVEKWCQTYATDQFVEVAKKAASKATVEAMRTLEQRLFESGVRR